MIMEAKTARQTILIDPAKKRALQDWCASQDVTPSQVVRHLMRDYLAQYGVDAGAGSVDEARPDLPTAP